MWACTPRAALRLGDTGLHHHDQCAQSDTNDFVACAGFARCERADLRSTLGSTPGAVAPGSAYGLLEPYGGNPDWRQEMWGAIVALHGRYPRALANLKDEWWTDDAHTETLCALAVWRTEIDDAGADPREELAFQTQLSDYAHALRQEGRGVTKAWSPGAPPGEWAGG